MKKITLLITLLLSIIGTSAIAADISLVLRAPNVVAAGERFRVEFILSNVGAEKFNAPSFTGLDVLAGPILSTGMEIIMLNGKQTRTDNIIYTYTVQASQNSKKATISATSVLAENGKTYSTKATSIEISESTTTQQSGQSRSQSGTIDKDAVLLRMEVSKTQVYKGEALVASLKIYTQVGISGLESPKMPAFNGFWKQELELGTPQPTRESLGGKVYDSQIISQWLVYPQRTGVIEIEQTDLVALAQVVTQASGSSMFDNFFGTPNVEIVRRKLVAPAVKITVKELPQPAPGSFSGGVGQFHLSSSISTSEVTANSGGSITLKLTGTGDFPLIAAPVIEFPTGFEKYDTKQSEEIRNTTSGTAGTRTWEYPFIARAEGEYTIPSAEFTYFDPKTSKYTTLKSDEFKIKVLKDTNPNSNNATIVSGVTKENLKVIGQDIHFIHTQKHGLHKRGEMMLWSVTFFITFTLLIILFFLMLILLKKQIKNRQDIVRTKNKKANGVALRRLKKAKNFMSSGNENGFYEEILRALWGYMGDKLSISVSDLSKERLREEFAKRGVNAQQGEEFLTLISECEMAQYSPVGSIQMGGAYEAALDLIGRLELK